jgi:hypothetical protein
LPFPAALRTHATVEPEDDTSAPEMPEGEQS